MAWSKAFTSTYALLGSNQGANLGTNAGNLNEDGVLQEYVAFLVTRGWEVIDFTKDVGQNQKYYEWELRKRAVTEDGGTCAWDFVLRYDAVVGGGDDTLKMWAKSPNGPLGGGLLLDLQLYEGVSIVGSKLSMWESDLDSDSFFIMAEDHPSDFIIGFWPPSGSLFSQGFASSDFPVSGGVKPLFINGPSWEYSQSDYSQGFNFPWSDYGAGMNASQLKLDLVWVMNEYNRPLFKSFGSDIHSLVKVGVSSRRVFSGSNVLSNDPTSVMLIDGEYWIVAGYESSMMFNCGATAPVF